MTIDRVVCLYIWFRTDTQWIQWCCVGRFVFILILCLYSQELFVYLNLTCVCWRHIAVVEYMFDDTNVRNSFVLFDAFAGFFIYVSTFIKSLSLVKIDTISSNVGTDKQAEHLSQYYKPRCGDNSSYTTKAYIITAKPNYSMQIKFMRMNSHC